MVINFEYRKKHTINAYAMYRLSQSKCSSLRSKNKPIVATKCLITIPVIGQGASEFSCCQGCLVRIIYILIVE